jgi:hypothetical protein
MAKKIAKVKSNIKKADPVYSPMDNSNMTSNVIGANIGAPSPAPITPIGKGPSVDVGGVKPSDVQAYTASDPSIQNAEQQNAIGEQQVQQSQKGGAMTSSKATQSNGAQKKIAKVKNKGTFKNVDGQEIIGDMKKFNSGRTPQSKSATVNGTKTVQLNAQQHADYQDFLKNKKKK